MDEPLPEPVRAPEVPEPQASYTRGEIEELLTEALATLKTEAEGDPDTPEGFVEGAEAFFAHMSAVLGLPITPA